MDLVLGKCSEELLPQSSSDFIYAIIVEEYVIGGFGVLILYLLLLFRFVVASQSQYALWKVSRRWTRFSDDFQAMVNMVCGRVIAGRDRHYDK
jgi:cell division protein FtsW